MVEKTSPPQVVSVWKIFPPHFTLPGYEESFTKYRPKRNIPEAVHL
jgi:hypothetical protein